MTKQRKSRRKWIGRLAIYITRKQGEKVLKFSNKLRADYGIPLSALEQEMQELNNRERNHITLWNGTKIIRTVLGYHVYGYSWDASDVMEIVKFIKRRK